ncbi:MAG: hypothetical protein R3A13_12035 [Bdellovibrionota bacterium]
MNTSEDENTLEDQNQTEEEAPHDHSADETNPDAVEGHYHIYLDAETGTDPHITAWVAQGEYSLPTNIASGTHSLRFELRDNEHLRLGTADSEAVLFFNVE